MQALHISCVTIRKVSLSALTCTRRCGVGDLDEAVQALKATAEGTAAAACKTGGTSVLEDDELKPSFMRRVASDRSPTANEAAVDDPNPRPLTRRRTEATRSAQPAKAKAAMQVHPCHLSCQTCWLLMQRVGELVHAHICTLICSLSYVASPVLLHITPGPEVLLCSAITVRSVSVARR